MIGHLAAVKGGMRNDLDMVEGLLQGVLFGPDNLMFSASLSSSAMAYCSLAHVG